MGPTLATKIYTKDGSTFRITVKGGLDKIGTQDPYFSITADIDEKRGGTFREFSGGCCHDEIEEQFPGKFSDLIAMHLSNMDGISMHSIENGFYWLAGAAPGHFDQQYHGANSSPEKSSAECLRIAAKHFRISMEQAQAFLDRMVETYRRVSSNIPAGLNGKDRAARLLVCRDEARSELFIFVNSQLDRWKAEAESCIAKHNLKIFS